VARAANLAMLAMAGPNYQTITVELFPAPLKNIDARRNCAVGWRGGKSPGLDANGVPYGGGGATIWAGGKPAAKSETTRAIRSKNVAA
jgi:hypothetical protein